MIVEDAADRQRENDPHSPVRCFVESPGTAIP